jgi:hypothetical protein
MRLSSSALPAAVGSACSACSSCALGARVYHWLKRSTLNSRRVMVRVTAGPLAWPLSSVGPSCADLHLLLHVVPAHRVGIGPGLLEGAGEVALDVGLRALDACHVVVALLGFELRAADFEPFAGCSRVER